MNWKTRAILGGFISLSLYSAPLDASTGGQNSCPVCHGSQAKMLTMGYPHFAINQDDVEKQSGMPATCADCHLGKPGEMEKEKAHEGMGRIILVRKRGLKGETTERRLPLEMGGNPMLRIRYQTEKDGKAAVDPSISGVLYQDKRKETLSQDFEMMQKTCGACHAAQFKEFKLSNMAKNAKQSRYNAWNSKERGPHNCGVWFEGNSGQIAANTSAPFPPDVQALNQRSCNTCHVGCLDCHYDPQERDPKDLRKGIHTFNRKPRPESCYGGGRGTTCHAGPEERRRGAGYFGGSFSHPEGMGPDVHLARGVGCLECHANSGSNRELGHGSVQRRATCDNCHAAALKSNEKSAHRNLSCEACHIQDVGGYQATFWGIGALAGSETPFFKYKDYYGVMREPILIRDQQGRWIPVKPFPMAVMNQKTGPDLKPGLHWRWPKGLPELERTDDAWGYVGLFGGLPENNSAILWIQMDKLSHKYGKSRSCESCHGSKQGEQRQDVEWEFTDMGAMPFSGRHSVIAGKSGLYIRGMEATERIEPTNGYKLSSLAPFIYLKDKWAIPGDFAIPAIRDMKGYEKGKTGAGAAREVNILHR